ncbi:hypothetical protein PV326_002158, partial [Microctonus aethiopoides]
MSICSDVISPSSKPSPKTIAEPEYNRQYRLKKKVDAKLKSDSAKIVLRQEVGPSEYPTSVPTMPLTQLSSDAGPTIIQHEAVTVYSSVNKKVRDVIDFLHEALLAYTKGGLKLLNKRYHEISLILGGDFNYQFDTDQGLRCVQFLKKETEFGLRF